MAQTSPIVQSLLTAPAAAPDLWLLDPNVTFLNHGSFGACPRAVLDFQSTVRVRMERQPVQFLARDLEPLLDKARAALADFVAAPPDDLVLLANATTGVNTILRSLRFEAGDELLATNHEYNACRNALDFVAARSGARVIIAELPFPLRDPADVTGRILEKVTSRTRLALIDHVTSQTGLVLPAKQIIDELNARGVETLIDGAHAPGMVPLNVRELGAAYYTGNCHKWLCAPKTAAFLYVRPDRQRLIRPLAISHGANSPRTDRSRFQIEFAWSGTWDPSAALSIPEALRVLGALLPGGWESIRERNRALALAGRQLLCTALEIAPPCPDEMIGSLASVPLPDGSADHPAASPLYLDPLQDELRNRYGIEVPIIPWPAPPKRLLRISAQLYNCLGDYEKLAAALNRELPPS